MEHCSWQCIHRTLYAVMIGVSPIVICLLLIAAARLILHRLETTYNRRQKPTDRRSSSSYYPPGRSTISYTPIPSAELQRILQGEYHSQQRSESLSSIVNNDNGSPKASKFMKSILTRCDPALPTAKTLSKLVVRRDAIDSTPFTALFAPNSTSVTPIFDLINEQTPRQSRATTMKHESIETSRLTTINIKNNYSSEFEQTETDSLLTKTKKLVVDEFLDFHSVSSVPCSLNLASSIDENDF